MYRSVKSLIFLFIFSFLAILITVYSCGSGGEDSSTNSESQSLSAINGRITEVLALKIDKKESRLAEIKNTLSFTVTATAQGSFVDGILVMAISNDGGPERLLDEDTTSFDGSFSLFVPAGDMILRFEVGEEVFEKAMQVPEEADLDILVSIDKDDNVEPVMILEPGEETVNDNENEPEEEVIDEPEETDEDQDVNDNEVPEPEGNADMDSEEDESGQEEEEDEGQENNDPPSSGNGDITSAEMLTSVNSRRAQGANCGSQGSFGPQGALSVSNSLGQAALAHSIDMSENNFFSHTGSNGSSPIDRMRDAGFNGNGWGENISRASYERSAEEVVAGWMTSDGHCANIMTPGFNVLGSAKAANSSWENWTLNLGTE